jgi:hypothetical protein
MAMYIEQNGELVEISVEEAKKIGLLGDLEPLTAEEVDALRQGRYEVVKIFPDLSDVVELTDKGRQVASQLEQQHSSLLAPTTRKHVAAD